MQSVVFQTIHNSIDFFKTIFQLGTIISIPSFMDFTLKILYSIHSGTMELMPL
jgi:hypothetical protein